MSLKIFALLLLAHQAFAWFEGCDHDYQITNNVLVQSPYYPNRYPSGSSCRYSFTAPLDYKINIQCTIELDKPSSACSTEFFYVAVDGDKQMANSQYYCGSGQVNLQSQFRKIVFAYTSSSSQTAGRFSCSLTLVAPTAQNCDCGWSISSKIVGGTETRVNEFPSMVALVNKPDNSIFCGGTIINHYYVLSAAHCFYQTIYNNPNNIWARVGEHDTKTNAESKYTLNYGVSSITIHNQYNPNGDLNDIALVRVSSPIEWSMGVGPSCLPYLYRYTDFTNAYATIVGWGTTAFAGPKSAVLQKATVVVDSANNCLQTYPGLTANQICTKPPYNSNSDACQFDSGGPVYYVAQRQYSIGTISFGQYCGNGKPAINTKVAAYLPWIESIAGSGFCQK